MSTGSFHSIGVIHYFSDRTLSVTYIQSKKTKNITLSLDDSAILAVVPARSQCIRYGFMRYLKTIDNFESSLNIALTHPIAYIDNTLSSIPETLAERLGITFGSKLASRPRRTSKGTSPYEVFNVLEE